MKVLLNALQAGNRSGTGRYAAHLSQWLPQVSGGVQVVTLWPRGVPRPGGGAGDVVLCDVHGGFSRVWYDQVSIHRLRRRLGAALIHYPANVGALLPSHGSVVTVHDLSFFRAPEWYRFNRAQYYRAAVRRSVSTARHVIADSQATADDLGRFLRVEARRITVAPLGVEEHFRPAPAEAIDGARAKYALPERFILYVGTLEPRKNLVRLVEAYSRVAGRCDCDLVLAGREGWKTEAVHTAIKASPFAGRIHLPGFIEQDHLAAVVSAAHAFAWPSLYEGFGLPPLEAMACGTPVLTSDVSSLPEVVGDAALLVNPYDTEAIAHGLETIATDGALRAGLKARGRIQAQRFSWRRTAEIVAEVYRRTTE